MRPSVEARLLATSRACAEPDAARYIRHDVDFNFYLSAAEPTQRAQVRDAVAYAFDFVLRARA